MALSEALEGIEPEWAKDILAATLPEDIDAVYVSPQEPGYELHGWAVSATGVFHCVIAKTTRRTPNETKTEMLEKESTVSILSWLPARHVRRVTVARSDDGYHSVGLSLEIPLFGEETEIAVPPTEDFERDQRLVLEELEAHLQRDLGDPIPPSKISRESYNARRRQVHRFAEAVLRWMSPNQR